MKYLFLLALVWVICNDSFSQTHFTAENISSSLCKTWKVNYTTMNGVKTEATDDSILQNSTMQFFADNTFVFFMGDEQLFGHWNFYPADQSLFIDFSTDHLFDQNYSLHVLNDAEFNCTASYYNIGKQTWVIDMVPNETN